MNQKKTPCRIYPQGVVSLSLPLGAGSSVVSQAIGYTLIAMARTKKAIVVVIQYVG